MDLAVKGGGGGGVENKLTRYGDLGEDQYA